MGKTRLPGALAGDWLRSAGQLGQSQTNAGEKGQPATCCQEHVQADGQSAQQDALLQCKKSCSYGSIYISVIRTENIGKQRVSNRDDLLTDARLINICKGVNAM